MLNFGKVYFNLAERFVTTQQRVSEVRVRKRMRNFVVDPTATADFFWSLQTKVCPGDVVGSLWKKLYTLQGTNISPKNGILKMIFLFLRWDMLIPWRVCLNPVAVEIHNLLIYYLFFEKPT